MYFGALQSKRNSKHPRSLLGGWVYVCLLSLGILFCFGISSQNRPKPVMIFWSTVVVYHVYSVCIYIERFQKKFVWDGCADELYSVLFGIFLNLFNFAKHLNPT